MDVPDVSYDKDGNTAYINFSDTAEERKSLPVKDNNDEVTAVLDFSAKGELLGVELLVADVQLPRSLHSNTGGL